MLCKNFHHHKLQKNKHKKKKESNDFLIDV